MFSPRKLFASALKSNKGIDVQMCNHLIFAKCHFLELTKQKENWWNLIVFFKQKKRTVVLTYVLLFHLNPLIMRCKCIIYTAWNSFWVKLSDWERSEADILHDKGVSLNAEIAVCKKKPYVPWNHIHEKCLFEIYHDPSVTWREIFIRFLLCI